MARRARRRSARGRQGWDNADLRRLRCPRREHSLASAPGHDGSVRHDHGVSTVCAVRIFKNYGAEAITIITDNPYRLARDIRGIGFRSADAIAERPQSDAA